MNVRPIANPASKHIDSIIVAVAEMRRNFERRNNETTDLHRAVRLRNLDDIKRLLAAGADINKKDDNGDTPLLIESKCTEPGFEIIEVLLKANPTMSLSNDDGVVAICHAAAQGHVQKIKAFTDYKYYHPAYTGVVYYAVQSKNIETIDLLINSGAPITDANNDGVSPLALTALHNDLPMAKHLIQFGALKNEQDAYLHAWAGGRKGSTALQIATAQNHQEMIKLLLASKVDPNLRYDERHFSPLMIAVNTDNISATKILTDAGADVNAIYMHERQASALEEISGWGVVKRDYKLVVDEKETVLDLAIKQNNSAMINLLKAKGAKESSSCSMM